MLGYITMFADDTVKILINCEKGRREPFKMDNTWFETIKLKLNEQKTQYL